MATPPLSGAVSAESLADYFRRIADAVPLPVIVQDASGYVGQAIPLGVYMATFPPIAAFFRPVTLVGSYVPTVVFIPLSIAWFGPRIAPTNASSSITIARGFPSLIMSA